MKEVNSQEKKELSTEKLPSIVPPNYNEICEKLLSNMEKDYQKTLESNIPNEDEGKKSGINKDEDDKEPNEYAALGGEDDEVFLIELQFGDFIETKEEEHEKKSDQDYEKVKEEETEEPKRRHKLTESKE